VLCASSPMSSSSYCACISPQVSNHGSHCSCYGAITKVANLEKLVDPHVELISDLQGKVKKARPLDIDFMDATLFPQMEVNTYMDYTALPSRKIHC
jgi:hypothetical protein